jgi:putative ABC transport system permease protein
MHRHSGWLFTQLGLQNLLRRPGRTFMLVLAVALGSGAIFASLIVGLGINASMQQSFDRMGADLVVLPDAAMVNITSALLTVQPTDASLDEKLIDEIAHLDGVAQVAPQTIYRVSIMSGMPEHRTNLIAFDPKRDFTVTPWLNERMPGAMQKNDIICGARRTENLGDEIMPAASPANVYAKLGLSGVGPFDESIFAPYATVAALTSQDKTGEYCVPRYSPTRVSAVLVRLKFGATPEQVRFSIARFPAVKVVTGARIVTSTRQTTTILVAGLLGFAAVVLLASLLLMSLLFSAIIAERHREIGLLRAIGSRRANIVRMLLAEAGFSTGAGGVCGILFGAVLLLGFQHSLVYYLETLHVEFKWPGLLEMALAATLCAVVAAAVGILGSLVPAWSASGKEPYELINGGGN